MWDIGGGGGGGVGEKLRNPPQPPHNKDTYAAMTHFWMQTTIKGVCARNLC